MNETDSILESRLRSFEPAALDEALLARLESCADDSILEPRPEDARLKSEGATFGVNCQDEYIVRDGRWVENTEE